MALGKGLQSLIPHTKKESTGPLSGDRLYHIAISEITPNTEQPRKTFTHKELEDLVASIKKHGVLQPITVIEKDDGGYELIAGERRLRASQIAGKTTIPALVRTATEQEKLELALIENIQRQDLNPIEEAYAYNRLTNEFGLTQQEVGDQVGKSRPYIANIIRLLDLPEEIQKALIDKRISVGKARALLSLKSTNEQLKIFASMLGEGVNVRDVERAVEEKGAASRKGSIRRDPNVHAQEKLLEERLGAKVRISQKGERGTITIDYYSLEELKRILEELL